MTARAAIPMPQVQLTDYTTLGRTGLRVSPLCLGTMTFGAAAGFGADNDTCRHLLERYVELGGNFIDTADGYGGGQSEKLVGEYVRQHELRDRVVIATKCGFSAQRGNPNAGGNGRKNIFRAVEGSLRRLQTEYIDLYYLHVWDLVTPPEEVVDAMTDLVRAGKVRYYGLSDTPAWYIARAQTLAECHGVPRAATIQHEYSLIERSIEREHLPAAQELGLGVCVWAPLGGGFLTGKYGRRDSVASGAGRLVNSPQVRNRFTERNWRVLDVLTGVAEELGRPCGQIAMHWAATRPGVTCVITGATSLSQLDDNLNSLDLDIPAELGQRLEQASALEAAHPYIFFARKMQQMVSGDTSLRGWQRAYGLLNGNAE